VNQIAVDEQIDTAFNLRQIPSRFMNNTMQVHQPKAIKFVSTRRGTAVA